LNGTVPFDPSLAGRRRRLATVTHSIAVVSLFGGGSIRTPQPRAHHELHRCKQPVAGVEVGVARALAEPREEQPAALEPVVALFGGDGLERSDRLGIDA
jgi:hypothetical protein